MFDVFMRVVAPSPDGTVLDIGARSDQIYALSNEFEALYSWKDRVTGAGLDDASFLAPRYPGMRYVHADGRDLPFPDGSFDLVHSSAVLEQCLASRPDVTAATGVAMKGRTMKLHTQPTLNNGARLHGQLHAPRPEFVADLVARGLRIPIGLHDGDGLMGSMVMHDQDPVAKPDWNPGRIGADPKTAYEIPALSPFRYRDLKRQ